MIFRNFRTTGIRALEEESETQKYDSEAHECRDPQLTTDVLDGLLKELQAAAIVHDGQQRQLPCSYKFRMQLERAEDDNENIDAAELRCKVNLLQSQVDALTSRMGTLIAREQTAEEVARAAKDDLANLRRSLASAGLGRPELLRRVLKALEGISPDIVLTVADWLGHIKTWPGLTGDHVRQMLDGLYPGAAVTVQIAGSAFEATRLPNVACGNCCGNAKADAIQQQPETPASHQRRPEGSAHPLCGCNHIGRCSDVHALGGEGADPGPPGPVEAKPSVDSLCMPVNDIDAKMIQRTVGAWCSLPTSSAAARSAASLSSRRTLGGCSSSSPPPIGSPSSRQQAAAAMEGSAPTAMAERSTVLYAGMGQPGPAAAEGASPATPRAAVSWGAELVPTPSCGLPSDSRPAAVLTRASPRALAGAAATAVAEGLAKSPAAAALPSPSNRRNRPRCSSSFQAQLPPPPAAAPEGRGGVGLLIGLRGGRMVVSGLAVSGAAARGGRILPGDELMAVDGRSVAGLCVAGVAALIAGPAGTHVDLDLLRFAAGCRAASAIRAGRGGGGGGGDGGGEAFSVRLVREAAGAAERGPARRRRLFRAGDEWRRSGGWAAEDCGVDDLGCGGGGGETAAGEWWRRLGATNGPQGDSEAYCSADGRRAEEPDGPVLGVW